MRVGVLISGRGSNMVALAEVARDSKTEYQIVGVLSNNQEAEGIKHAYNFNLPVECIKHTDFKTREDFEFTVVDVLTKWDVDVVCLAGFMRILSPFFVDFYPNRILNIHPSLLPLFPGLNTHQRVLESGMKKHGCTVHIVSKELDSGPILGQMSTSINSYDTIDSLAERVLRLEHRLYPAVVNAIAKNEKLLF